MQKEQIQWLPGTNLTAGQLMEWHTRAMYTFNLSGRLLLVNEPWPNPPKAVRMFLTRSLDGDIFYRFRSDLTESLIGELTKWTVQEKAPRADFTPMSRRVLAPSRRERGGLWALLLDT